LDTGPVTSARATTTGRRADDLYPAGLLVPPDGPA